MKQAMFFGHGKREDDEPGISDQTVLTVIDIFRLRPGNTLLQSSADVL
jgi:hypothetical protein